MLGESGNASRAALVGAAVCTLVAIAAMINGSLGAAGLLVAGGVFLILWAAWVSD